MRRVDHPEFYSRDLPRLEEEFGNRVAFVECLEAFDKAIREITRNPQEEGAPLERSPLTTYRKKKFHSQLRPSQGAKADMRIVYRVDIEKDTLYVLGLGKRRPLDPDDIYAILNIRSHI